MESYGVYALQMKYEQEKNTHKYTVVLLYDMYNSFHVINWDFYSRSHILTLDTFSKAQDF